ncbi:MAG: hypothetical protein QE267_12665 [Akkermansiaceae bacterium]|nr:hypothetical protein [Akkermansiaceae bacterium]
MRIKTTRLRSNDAHRVGVDRGFALIVTLSLMILLTVIAVGLLTLSSISLRTSTRAGAQQQAQANARLAVMMALGELQKELGPDQRISAPGSQLLEEANVTGPKHWIGVYESWKGASWPFATSEEIRPSSPTFRRWLISGDETIVTNKDTPKTGLAAGDKVKLVAATKAQGSTPAQDAVEAGLVKLPQGGTAWWIGDQNTKAKLGVVVEDAADAKVAAARLQSAPRAAHEVFPGMENLLANDPRLGKLPSTKSLQLLAKDTDFFHGATTASLGLLTNMRAGGLRKDLNFLLEKPIPSAGTAATTALYTAAGSSPASASGTPIPFEGINLGELWVDHNIWGELKFGPPTHADGSSLPSGAPYLECGAKADPFLNYKHLPRLQLTQLYSLISKSRTTTAGKKVYDLYLATDPIFTIWNPFDVCLHVPQSYFAMLKTWAIPYDLNLTLQGGPAGSKGSYTSTIGDIYRQGTNNAVFVFQGTLGNVGKTSQNLVLRPGEVQVMAQGVGAPINYNPAGVDWDAKLGWEFASGYAYKINYEPNDPTEIYKTGTQRITYSMAPNAKKSDNTGLMLWSYGVPGANPFIGSFNINFINSRLQGQGEITANSFQDIFKPLPLDVSASKTIAELENNKWPICVFTYGLRTESDPFLTSGKRSTGRSMLRANATSLGQDLFNLDPAVVRTSPLQVGMRRVNSLSDQIVECDVKGLGYYGAGYSSNGGVSHVVTRSIPREPIHSLGALQHGAAEGKKFGQAVGEKTWFLQPSVSHAIANSFAPSFLGPSEVRGTLAGWPAADHSYLANLALWDTYFYSSIKPRTQSAHKSPTTAYFEQKKRLEDFLATGTAYKPLPNERMKPWTSDPAAALKAIFPTTTPVSNAADLSASFLMVDGMFNVNSTSVTAWKSFLSGLKKAKVPSNPTPGIQNQPDLPAAKGTAVAALFEAAGKEIDDTTLGDTSDAEQWRGFRSLTDPQIEELAKAIVKQVRLRGPFLSISDFVNRRPGSDKDLAVSGALQSALDDNDVSINKAYRQSTRSLSLSEAQAQGFPFPEAEAGPKAIGSPGYVKQGDLLTSLGPMIAVRGDTFLIRGYGEARDASGKNVLARSWCEAMVQRVPDYVDPTNNAYDALTALNNINKTLGRRFNIVSFRYLDSREIL